MAIIHSAYLLLRGTKARLTDLRASANRDASVLCSGAMDPRDRIRSRIFSVGGMFIPAENNGTSSVCVSTVAVSAVDAMLCCDDRCLSDDDDGGLLRLSRRTVGLAGLTFTLDTVPGRDEVDCGWMGTKPRGASDADCSCVVVGAPAAPFCTC